MWFREGARGPGGGRPGFQFWWPFLTRGRLDRSLGLLLSSLVSQLVKESACIEGNLSSIPGLGRFPWRRERLPTPMFLGFPCGSAGKEYTCSVGDLGSIAGLGRSPGEGNGNPLHYSGLENSMDYTVHGITKGWTGLSDFHLFHLV